jgi:hypothetical protein
MAAIGAPTKSELLRSAGYRYNFEMMHYVNRQERKAFSVEFIEDHDEAELERCIAKEPKQAGWEFFFNEEPTGSTRKLLEQNYEKNGPRPL